MNSKFHHYNLKLYNAKHELDYEEKFYVDKSFLYEDVLNQIVKKIYQSNIAIDPDNMWIIIGGGIDERSKFVNIVKVEKDN